MATPLTQPDRPDHGQARSTAAPSSRKTFKVRSSDNRIIYDKIAYRPPATCQARYNDRSGENNGFRQQVWLFGGNLALNNKQKVPGYVDIPKVRSYVHTHGKHREPLTEGQ